VTGSLVGGAPAHGGRRGWAAGPQAEASLAGRRAPEPRAASLGGAFPHGGLAGLARRTHRSGCGGLAGALGQRPNAGATGWRWGHCRAGRRGCYRQDLLFGWTGGRDGGVVSAVLCGTWFSHRVVLSCGHYGNVCVISRQRRSRCRFRQRCFNDAAGVRVDGVRRAAGREKENGGVG